MKRFSYLVVGAVLVLLSACVTLKGDYLVRAVDDSGQLLNKGSVMTAQGRHIYTVRNALCAAFPKAKIIITDTSTKQELSGESPYQCR